MTAGTPLPRGRHGIDKDVVRAHQRSRLIDATIETVAQLGYGPTTVGRIVARARVSRETFYELFSGKADCYHAALSTAIQQVDEAFENAMSDQSATVPTRLERGLRAYFEALAQRPSVARCWVLELPPERPLEEDVRGSEGLIDRLQDVFGIRDRFAVVAFLALVHGIVERLVRNDRTTDLPELVGPLLPVALRVLEV